MRILMPVYRPGTGEFWHELSTVSGAHVQYHVDEIGRSYTNYPNSRIAAEVDEYVQTLRDLLLAGF